MNGKRKEKPQHIQQEQESQWASRFTVCSAGRWWLMTSYCSFMSFSWGRVAQFQFKVITKYISIFFISYLPEVRNASESFAFVAQTARVGVYLSPSSEKEDYSVVFWGWAFVTSSPLQNDCHSKLHIEDLCQHFPNSHFASNPQTIFFSKHGSVPFFASCTNLPSTMSVCLQFFEEISLFSHLASFCFPLHDSLLTYTPFHVCTYWPFSSLAESHLFTLVHN